jgi:hypothetical protein
MAAFVSWSCFSDLSAESALLGGTKCMAYDRDGITIRFTQRQVVVAVGQPQR